MQQEMLNGMMKINNKIPFTLTFFSPLPISLKRLVWDYFFISSGYISHKVIPFLLATVFTLYSSNIIFKICI